MSSATGAGPEGDRAIAAFGAESYAASGAEGLGIGQPEWAEILSAVVERWKDTACADVTSFLRSLRMEELALTRACAAGNEAAWERFLNRYRNLLYGAAYKIAHDEATARELADSLYGELYGISEKGRERASKLLYYSGRGSLEGWLRTIVAQEYVNRYRSTRRESSLDEAVEEGQQFAAAETNSQATVDRRVDDAIAAELAEVDAEDRLLLVSYYLDGRKLAEIARLQRVHESTISRKLEKATAALRKRIRKRLMAAGMSAREADETMQDVDVRDVETPVEKSLRQETQGRTFYQGSEPQE